MMKGGADRDFPMQLFRLEVHCGRAVVGPPLPAERAGGKQHRLGQLGFAGRTLTDDRDASQTSDFLHSHGVCSWGSFLVFVWPLRVMLWRAQCSGNAPACSERVPRWPRYPPCRCSQYFVSYVNRTPPQYSRHPPEPGRFAPRPPATERRPDRFPGPFRP